MAGNEQVQKRQREEIATMGTEREKDPLWRLCQEERSDPADLLQLKLALGGGREEEISLPSDGSLGSFCKTAGLEPELRLVAD